MLNYLKKFAMEILPSVAATIIGAYIVNHYINARPADAPAHAAVSTAAPKAQAKAAPKPAPAETAAIPEPGIKAKGISERAMIENRAAERPAEVKPDAKPEATAETKPAETPKPSDKTSEVATAPHRRDAADLARAAIERLRGSREPAPRTQEAARTPPAVPAAPRLEEAPRTVVAAPATQPAVAPDSLRPLPPPITVSTPPTDPLAASAAGANPPYTAAVDPNRPVPPAEIPPPPARPPIDLRADANKLATRTTNVAQDVLAATKNMFHSLLPGDNDRQSGNTSQFTD
jgi:hypothetical protein